MSRYIESQAALGERWLLLVHQLPAQPAYMRVKLWRRLQALGAVPIKKGVHALPSTADALEDFEWLMREVVAGGGEATIVEARLVDGLTDEQLRGLFNAARDEDYRALEADAAAMAESFAGKGAPRSPDAVARLQARLGEIVAVDFFGSTARTGAQGAVDAAIEAQEESRRVEADQQRQADEYRGRVWVTRAGVFIDRIASAWFILRFIDPAATLKFVPGRNYGRHEGETRFDMFEAEFTHVGDACTMEVLVQHFRPDDLAARAVAEIVHDIDLKDGKFGRSEADGIRTLVAGICARWADDQERVERGRDLFDDLYASFDKRP